MPRASVSERPRIPPNDRELAQKTTRQAAWAQVRRKRFVSGARDAAGLARKFKANARQWRGCRENARLVRRFSHVIGFDDAPFDRGHRGDVLVVGAVYAGPRLEGVLSAKVRRDGVNATRVLARLVQGSRFYPHLQLVVLQGIAFAGFNVVDLLALHHLLGVPVMTVVRRKPDFDKIRSALLEHVPGGRRKWKLIEKAGPVEPVGRVFVQRAGLPLAQAETALRPLCITADIPEPLRTAHLIAGGIARGESRHRA